MNELKKILTSVLISESLKWLLNAIGIIAIVQSFLPDFLNLQKMLFQAPPQILIKGLLVSTGIGFLSIAYVINARFKNKMIRFNNLLWHWNDLTPFCPRCKEVDKIEVHMKYERVKGVDMVEQIFYDKNQYKCTHCPHIANYSEHPKVIKKYLKKIKKDPKNAQQRHPADTV